MEAVKTYKTRDLVLEVSHSYDPTKLRLDEWDRFIDILCGDRQYQKEAVRQAIIYLAGGRYKSINDLIEENWKDSKKVELNTRYKSLNDYVRHIQLPKKLSGTIDLATGTGKSYVIYGIAQIMLGLDLVDKVLVLCPSLTIEKGLTEKFMALSTDSKLKETIPESAKYKNPRIIDANKTIKDGDVCVENIHAVYEKTGSSIDDSFKNAGERVLVLNDEAHHIFNKVAGSDKVSRSIKKWKEFLLNEDYKFHYMLGFTGTAYIDDDYFNNVFYRYALREAVEDQMVKMVDYVSEDDSIDVSEKFQKIYDNYRGIKDNYRKVKPLTILVTKDIRNAKRLASDLAEFLEEKEDLPLKAVEKKILVVTSHKDHKANVAKLADVDSKEDTTEWIVSVSMLTEGWDVKNIFQIVPWEDRAFNSKLLIAQVLGRGLRIPEEYQSPQPKVVVFNHDAWSRNIKGLVNEILEVELKLISSIIKEGERAKFNFDLYNINYDKKQKEIEIKRKREEFDYTKGYINLVAQVEQTEKKTEYTDLAGYERDKKTLIEYRNFSVNEIVNKIHDEFKTREWEGKILKLPEGEYTKKNLPPKEEIRKIITNSMKKVGIKGDRLVEKNRQNILKSFGTLLRKKGKTIIYEREAEEPTKVKTKGMDRESMSVGSVERGATVFYSDNYKDEVELDVKEALEPIIEDENLPRSASKEKSQYLFKTPIDLLFTRGTPERSFVEGLCKKDNAEKIEAFVKSRDQGFYSIEYTITTVAGKHTKQQSFNPDFFIKFLEDKTEYIVVVEIKADKDTSIENKAKLRGATRHFEDLNEELKAKGIKQKYVFHFLSPVTYSVFFDYLRDGRLIKGEFRSHLEDLLEQENGNGQA